MVKLTRGVKPLDFTDAPKNISYRMESIGDYYEVEVDTPTAEAYFRTKGFN